MMKDIEVIPAEQSHLNDIYRIFYEGFFGKLRFITGNPDLQQTFARDFNLFKIESGDREFVALHKNQVRGILSLRYSKQAAGAKPNASETGRLIRKYGLSCLVRAWLFDVIFRHQFEEGELYIDTVAVAAEARGNGIGTALLDFAERHAKESGFRKLTLMVIFENPKAQALYERQGFTVAAKHSLWLLKRSTGVSGAYFMTKNI